MRIQFVIFYACRALIHSSLERFHNKSLFFSAVAVKVIKYKECSNVFLSCLILKGHLSQTQTSDLLKVGQYCKGPQPPHDNGLQLVLCKHTNTTTYKCIPTVCTYSTHVHICTVHIQIYGGPWFMTSLTFSVPLLHHHFP